MLCKNLWRTLYTGYRTSFASLNISLKLNDAEIHPFSNYREERGADSNAKYGGNIRYANNQIRKCIGTTQYFIYFWIRIRFAKHAHAQRKNNAHVVRNLLHCICIKLHVRLVSRMGNITRLGHFVPSRELASRFTGGDRRCWNHVNVASFGGFPSVLCSSNS
ncbi:hypothetical protein Y032_0725g1858 [Ancylostoma ceylanicum]|uniref:Uncharacterized protein n=1 Tax=Ancylostoma ceylanicum TaxID=53326 RepID=A0A016WG86_9BILA|nr:hypothetical protein Y032_0725g1858 [Ancylostoma ceylanicum]